MAPTVTTLHLSTVPPPLHIFILQVPSQNLAAGDTVSLRCTALVPAAITTPVLPAVEWTVGDGESLPDTPRIQLSIDSRNTAVLTINPVLVDDAGIYTCSIYFEPTGNRSEYLYSSPSNNLDAGRDLSVDGRLK